jgi:hypothetical protein
MRIVLVLTLVLTLLAGCASTPKPAKAEPPPADDASAAEEPEEGQRSFLTSALLYLPNRLLDLLDPVRAGVQVGPGFGIDAQATRFVQAKAVSTLTVGAGYQTLRRLPIQAGPEAALGVGPVGGETGLPLPWYRSDSDIRLGLHVAIVGAHVAFDPVELLDIPLGFLGIDIADDDL